MKSSKMGLIIAKDGFQSKWRMFHKGPNLRKEEKKTLV